MRSLIRVLANLLRLLLSPLRLASARARKKRSHDWVYLRLPQHLTELHTAPASLPEQLVALRQRHKLSSLQELRELTDQLVRDPDVPGLCLHISTMRSGWATCESVRELLLRVRAAGKRVVCYLSEGGGNRELYLASAADRVVLVPWSWLGPFGFATQGLYFKRLLTRVGVQFDVHATGPYKSAAEPVMLDTMSDAAREQTAVLLQRRQNTLELALTEARKLQPEALRELFARGIVTAREALRIGLVDELCYEDELRRSLGDDKTEPTRPWRSAHSYLRERSYRIIRPVREAPYVGVVSVTGPIADKKSGMTRGADRPSVVATLRQAARDPLVRAVVLHIDSPGGSAFASELIHHAVEELARVKPVVAYVGDVAASGGYYIAAPCQSIVARPLSITGSIGVVSAKPAVSDLLERVGINTQTLRTAPHADMLTSVRPQSPSEKQVWHELTQELYGRFLEVVSNGRKRPVAEVEALAGGRVWSGHEAEQLKLVDALGGIERALELARAAVQGLTPAQRERLSLRAYRAKSASDAAPPTTAPLPSPVNLLNQLGLGEASADLAFLFASHREPCAYYAWGLSQDLD